MRRRALRLPTLLLGLVTALLANASAAAKHPAIPPLSGPVVDSASVISPGVRGALTAVLLELKEKTGAELAILTVPDTGPLTAFDYGMEVLDSWQLGAARDDRGLLLLLALEQRRVRFFSGYGLEGLLPDGKLGEILDTYATPALRSGDISAGLYNAALAAAQVIATEAGVTLSGSSAKASPPPRARRRVNPLGLIWLLFAFPGMLLRGRRRRGLMYMPMFFGGTLGGGGFGGGLGGGFGGLGGGFGGGGAGRGW